MARDFLDNRFVSSARDLGGRGWKSGLDAFGGFRKFLLRGNVVDLAVGVVIGAAFSTIVQGAVTDLIQPLIGLVSQGSLKSLNDWKVGPAEQFLLGHFIGLIISFLITAAIVYFFVVLPLNSLHDRYNRLVGKEEEVTTRECPFCVSTIPLKATRCAYCTSQIPPAEAEPSIGSAHKH
jgi:large conductance mechanosensitive channel